MALFLSLAGRPCAIKSLYLEYAFATSVRAPSSVSAIFLIRCTLVVSLVNTKSSFKPPKIAVAIRFCVPKDTSVIKFSPCFA